MGDYEIVKSGELYMHIKGVFKSSWQNKFCVLYARSSDQHPYLEVYESRQSFNDSKTSHKKCDKKLALSHVRSVSNGRQMESTDSSRQYHIEIKFRRDKQVLLFDKEHDAYDWYSKLMTHIETTEKTDDHSSSSVHDDDDDDDNVMTENLMYESSGEIPSSAFDVTVLESNLAKLCQIQGSCRLYFHPTTLAFENPQTKQIQQTIPFLNIRNYGKDKNVFTIVCGRKFVNGTGNIKIQSEQCKEMNLVMRNNMQQARAAPSLSVSQHERHSSASSHEHVDSDSSSGKHIPPPDSPVKHFPMSSANNMFKKHPGQLGPHLVPLQNKPHNTTTDDGAGNQAHDIRHSTKETDTKDNHIPADFKRTRSVGGSVHGVTSAFAKELQDKLLLPSVSDESAVKSKGSESKRGKIERELSEKERKKLQKEEEKRKKKENEELEKKRKEEQKATAKLNKKKEKELKDREKENIRKSKGGKGIEKPVVKPNAGSCVYEEVDTDISVLRSSGNQKTNQDYVYDEAASYPSKKQVASVAETVEYAQPYSRTRQASKQSNMSEYAEPYAVSKSVSGALEPVMYSDVEDVRSHGWKSHGRKEDEEIHEEDYTNIKNARQSKEPPPIPFKKYSEDETTDDTYNKLDFQHSEHRSQQDNPGNIYGVASGKAVGPLETSRSLSTDGSSDSGEQYDGSTEDEYDICTSAPSAEVASANGTRYYDEARAPSPMQAPEPPAESLYEQVS